MKFSTLTKLMIAAGVAAVAAVNSVQAGPVASKPFKEVAPAPAPVEDWWSGNISTGYDSLYMFRGADVLGGDSLTWVDLNLSAYGFTAGTWVAKGWGDANSYGEVDIYAKYAHDFGIVSLEGGGVLYLYPDTDIDSNWELNVKLSTSKIPYVTPSLFYAYDFEYEGSYLEFRLDGSIPIVADVLSINPYLLVSGSWDYQATGNNGYNNTQIGAVVVLHLKKNVTINPYIAYSFSGDAVEPTTGDELWGGVSVAVSF